jgi:hypothetical protein
VELGVRQLFILFDLKQKNLRVQILGIFMSRLVLDVNQETGNVSTFEPHGGPNQLWHFEEDGTIRSETDEVLDVSEGSTEPGAPVIVFPKHGGPNQIFRTVTVDE